MGPNGLFWFFRKKSPVLHLLLILTTTPFFVPDKTGFGGCFMRLEVLLWKRTHPNSI